MIKTTFDRYRNSLFLLSSRKHLFTIFFQILEPTEDIIILKLCYVSFVFQIHLDACTKIYFHRYGQRCRSE